MASNYRSTPEVWDPRDDTEYGADPQTPERGSTWPRKVETLDPLESYEWHHVMPRDCEDSRKYGDWRSSGSVTDKCSICGGAESDHVGRPVDHHHAFNVSAWATDRLDGWWWVKYGAQLRETLDQTITNNGYAVPDAFRQYVLDEAVDTGAMYLAAAECAGSTLEPRDGTARGYQRLNYARNWKRPALTKLWKMLSHAPAMVGTGGGEDQETGEAYSDDSPTNIAHYANTVADWSRPEPVRVGRRVDARGYPTGRVSTNAYTVSAESAYFREAPEKVWGSGSAVMLGGGGTESQRIDGLAEVLAGGHTVKRYDYDRFRAKHYARRSALTAKARKALAAGESQHTPACRAVRAGGGAPNRAEIHEYCPRHFSLCRAAPSAVAPDNVTEYTERRVA